MTQRREPTISETQPVSKEDAAARTRAGRRDPRVSLRQPEQAVVPKTSSLTMTAIIVALIAFVFAGFCYWQVIKAEQELVIVRAKASALESRILEFEKKFVISDGESTQSLTSIQLQVKENISEIRKLWGVAYDRNRNAISDLDKALKKASTSLKTVDQQAKKERTKLTKSLDALRTELALFRETYETDQKAVSATLSAAKARVAKMEQVETRVGKMENNLSKRIVETEEAIESIDAFRRQVNSDLTALKKWTQQTR